MATTNTTAINSSAFLLMVNGSIESADVCTNDNIDLNNKRRYF
jgi:hypothetical protein